MNGTIVAFTISIYPGESKLPIKQTKLLLPLNEILALTWTYFKSNFSILDTV
jgi:hypothetical protein